MPDVIRARCLCGRVRIAADPPSRFVAHCHCANCRMAHGAGVVTWVTFPADQVRIVSGQDDLTRYRSDTEAVWSFCRVCGTSILYESPRSPGVLDIAAGTIPGPLDPMPSRHDYADRAPDWSPILDDLPRGGGESGREPMVERRTVAGAKGQADG